MFSEIGNLFQNSWSLYDRASWLSVTPFFSRLLLRSGHCIPEGSGCQSPLFFLCEIIRYEHRKDIILRLMFVTFPAF